MGSCVLDPTYGGAYGYGGHSISVNYSNSHYVSPGIGGGMLGGGNMMGHNVMGGGVMGPGIGMSTGIMGPGVIGPGIGMPIEDIE